MTKLELEQQIAQLWRGMESALEVDPHGEIAARAVTAYNAAYRQWAAIPHYEPNDFVVA